MVVSALVFSTAGLFTKGVEAAAWDVIFWRGLFAALFTWIYVTWRGTSRTDFIAVGIPGWIVAIVGAAGSAAFISSFKFTAIGNVTLIYASAPVLAAVLAWWWIGERLTLAVACGCALAFSGVAIIVGGSFGALSLRGDLLALFMTFVLAFIMVIYRRCPQTPSAGPMALSCIILLPPALYIGDPFAIDGVEILILVVFGLVFALASVTLAEGAKRLPSGETALLSILESPFAPVLAWLVLSEIPSLATLAGGVLILIGVIGSQLPALRFSRPTLETTYGDRKKTERHTQDLH